MKLLQTAQHFALVISLMFLTACTSPGDNDNPSQVMTKATVGCLVANDFYAVYFSAYIKPATDNVKMSAKDKKALFRSYCKDIPISGTAFFTADLVGSELREMPIGIRIVEQALTGNDESKAESFKDIRTISEIPAKLYPRGVVEAQAQLDKNGYYAIYLLMAGDDAASDEDKLRIPLHLGVDPDATPMTTKIIMGVGVTFGFALIGFVGYRFMRRRNNL